MRKCTFTLRSIILRPRNHTSKDGCRNCLSVGDVFFALITHIGKETLFTISSPLFSGP